MCDIDNLQDVGFLVDEFNIGGNVVGIYIYNDWYSTIVNNHIIGILNLDTLKVSCKFNTEELAAEVAKEYVKISRETKIESSLGSNRANRGWDVHS